MNKIEGKWENDPIYSNGDDLIDKLLDFHNKTVWINQSINKGNLDPIAESQLSNNEGFNSSRIPFVYSETVKFGNKTIQNHGSERDFSHKSISFNNLGKILTTAFGQNGSTFSRRYPSAGALYPVCEIVFVFEEQVGIQKGIYIFDSQEYSLVKLDNVKVDDPNIKKSINISSKTSLPSRYAIAYAVNLKVATFKYGLRGYRHALIEVGAAAQAFRESCQENGVYEYCSSAFDDLSLGYLIGLNIRLFPIILTQWFGLK